MRRIELHIDDMNFSALANGPTDGDLVVLLHGFPQTARAWSAQVEALGDAGWHAVAPDLRGDAADARPAAVDDYTRDRVAGDVLAVAARLGAEGFHLVGHDLGGIIAWDVACRHPARVRTLAVASTPHLAVFAATLLDEQEQRVPPIALFRQPGVAEHALLDNDAAALRASYRGLDQQVIEEYVGHFSEPGALTAALNHFRAADFDDWLALPASTVPTLFMWGADDPYLSRAAALATSGHVNAPYTQTDLPGVGHWVPELAPDAVTELLHKHLRS